MFDDLLAPVFTEVAEVDWSAHIPRLIDYWCRVLLGEPGYDGAILTGAARSPDDRAADRPAPRELQPTCATPEPRRHQ